MPSIPRIPKEIILEHALKLLIRDGYDTLNIKALANEIGCSTQPISWHFGNMEGLRKELAEYALHYANEKIFAAAQGKEAFANTGLAYLDLAFEEPNLFRYLYMSNDSGYFIGGFDMITITEQNKKTVEQVAQRFQISKEKASVFCKNMIIYTHGLASYIASGLITTSREEVRQMLYLCSEGFLEKS